MTKRQKWGYGCAGVGAVLAIVFFAIAFAVSDAGLKNGFGAAAMVCLVAGANGLAVGISDNLAVGRWTGLVVGAVGFVGWGIGWLAKSCGDTDCTNLKAMFGWAALFSAIAAIASLFPQLFGGSGAPSQSSSSQSQSSSAPN
jgi:hypothetical protein